jgi:hypothetical protein
VDASLDASLNDCAILSMLIADSILHFDRRGSMVREDVAGRKDTVESRRTVGRGRRRHRSVLSMPTRVAPASKRGSYHVRETDGRRMVEARLTKRRRVASFLVPGLGSQGVWAKKAERREIKMGTRICLVRTEAAVKWRDATMGSAMSVSRRMALRREEVASKAWPKVREYRERMGAKRPANVGWSKVWLLSTRTDSARRVESAALRASSNMV